MVEVDGVAPPEEQRAFLAELRLLTLKYRIGIDGCGCCDSPYLYDIDKHSNGMRDGEYVFVSGQNTRIEWKPKK